MRQRRFRILGLLIQSVPPGTDGRVLEGDADMLMLFVDAALIGLIVAIMEEDDFPGWGPMIGTAIFIGLAGFGAEAAVGEGIAGIIAGSLAASVAGGLIISWLCGMSFRRALIAATVFLTIRFVLGLALYFMTRDVVTDDKAARGGPPPLILLAIGTRSVDRLDADAPWLLARRRPVTMATELPRRPPALHHPGRPRA